MKFGIAIFVGFVVCLFPVHGAETDVIRVFDDKLDVTDKEVLRYLKQADLENHGFEKTVEFSTVSDEYGRKKTKKTIYYKVTVDCAEVGKWEKVLKDRMPGALKRMDIFAKTVKEVEKRIGGRKTKECTVMLEVHPGRCLKKSNEKTKRAAAKRCGWWSSCCGCGICSGVSVVYDN